MSDPEPFIVEIPEPFPNGTCDCDCDFMDGDCDCLHDLQDEGRKPGPRCPGPGRYMLVKMEEKA